MAKRKPRVALAQSGRKLGPRALRTRQRLLDATEKLLVERSVMDVPVVEIARMAGTSPATFYHYFKDVEGAVLVLAEQAAEEVPLALASLDGSWDGGDGLERTRGLTEAFIDHWDRHHAVLLVRNLSADKGDARFQHARRAALSPVLDRLAKIIGEAQASGRVAPEIHPRLAAAALASILESLSAHYRSLRSFRATRKDLLETCSRIIYDTLTGGVDR